MRRATRLPLPAGRFSYGCRECGGRTCVNLNDPQLSEVQGGILRAAQYRYHEILLPCELFQAPWFSAVVAECLKQKIVPVVQVPLSDQNVIEKCKHVFALGGRVLLVGQGNQIGEVSSILSRVGQKFVEVLLLMGPEVTIESVARAFPASFSDLIYFQWPLATQDGFEDVSAINEKIKRLESLMPGVKVQAYTNVDVFDPRVPDDLETLPIEEPTIQRSTRSAQILISTIIPSFNSEKTIGPVLKHLFEQDLPAEQREVILIDDGSQDDSRSVVEKQLKDRDLNLRYYYLPRLVPRTPGDGRFRAGIARNLGALVARGQILHFLDSDIILPPDFLSKTVAEHEKYDVLQAKRIQLKKEATHQDIEYVKIEMERDTFVGHGAYWETFQDQTVDWHALKANWKYVSTFCISFRRQVFDELGWFRRSYVYYGFEDTDIGYRAFKSGKRLSLLDAKVFHMYHQDDRSEYQNSIDIKRQVLSRTAQIFFHQYLDREIYKELSMFMDSPK